MLVTVTEIWAFIYNIILLTVAKIWAICTILS